jgi:hypothetical protein
MIARGRFGRTPKIIITNARRTIGMSIIMGASSISTLSTPDPPKKADITMGI